MRFLVLETQILFLDSVVISEQVSLFKLKKIHFAIPPFNSFCFAVNPLSNPVNLIIKYTHFFRNAIYTSCKTNSAKLIGTHNKIYCTSYRYATVYCREAIFNELKTVVKYRLRVLYLGSKVQKMIVICCYGIHLNRLKRAPCGLTPRGRNQNFTLLIRKTII